MKSSNSTKRRVANYLIALLEDLLGPASREMRFEWCRGDASPSRPRGVPLPFDAVWLERNLIVEIHEDQHWKPVPHFDKPDRMTVSGVHRGVQRKLYDDRKVVSASAAGFTLIVIPWQRTAPRDLARDRDRLIQILAQHKIEPLPGAAPPAGSLR